METKHAGRLLGKGTGNFLEDEKDSAEKPYECFD
jgi:hypothetical protein